jgi:autotransporter-associated beta strand protein
MAAALILNGNLTIGGNATTLSPLNYSNQNVTINGRIIDSSSANVTLSAPGGNLRLTNAANNFRGGIVLGSDNNPASLTVTSISNSGVSSAIGNGPDIRFGLGTNTSAVTYSLIVESASGGSMNRNLLIYPANNTAGLTAKIVSAVAGQTVTIVGQAYNYGGVGNAHLELAGVGNGTFSGRINTVKDVTKSDSGTWTLSGSTNAFTGNTTVNAGTLIVSGTGTINTSAGVGINGSTSRLKYDSSVALSRNVSVTVGGTFAYNSSGSYAGALTLTNGKLAGTNWSGTLDNLSIGTNQTISPGNSPGTASTGNQTWAGGGSYLWEINNATGTAGADPGWDLLSGNGSLTISATSGSKFNILITSLTTGNVAGNASNFNGLTTDYKWKIADFASAITFDATAFALNTSAFSNTVVGGSTWAIARGDASGIGGDNTQLWVTYSIPEPSTWLLMAGSLAALAVLRRRRKLN